VPEFTRKHRARARASSSSILHTQTRELFFKRDLEERWQMSPVTFWRYRRAGLVPAPDLRCPNKDAWSRELIESYERQSAHCLAPKASATTVS
jgi:hypothetical protein